MAIAMVCPKCGGRVYLGHPEPGHWDYSPPHDCADPGNKPVSNNGVE